MKIPRSRYTKTIAFLKKEIANTESKILVGFISDKTREELSDRLTCLLVALSCTELARSLDAQKRKEDRDAKKRTRHK